MINLWKLKLYKFSLTKVILELILQNESVIYLSLKNCSLKKGFNLIPNFSRLKYLNLKYVEQVEYNVLIKLSEYCIKLEYLNVSCR